MPGDQVKAWPTYHALRERGASKQKAARIANAQAKRKLTRKRLRAIARRRRQQREGT